MVTVKVGSAGKVGLYNSTGSSSPDRGRHRLLRRRRRLPAGSTPSSSFPPFPAPGSAPPPGPRRRRPRATSRSPPRRAPVRRRRCCRAQRDRHRSHGSLICDGLARRSDPTDHLEPQPSPAKRFQPGDGPRRQRGEVPLLQRCPGRSTSSPTWRGLLHGCRGSQRVTILAARQSPRSSTAPHSACSSTRPSARPETIAVSATGQGGVIDGATALVMVRPRCPSNRRPPC